MALAAMEKALHQLHLYPDGNAFYLKQKLADKLGVTPANLVLGNGSNEVIELLGHLLLDHPESSFQNPSASPAQYAIRNTQYAARPSVLVSQYCFAVYPIVTALFGAKLIEVPAKNFGHDLD